MTEQITHVQIGANGELLIPMLGAALGPETQRQLREFFAAEGEQDERVIAWHRVAAHPFFKECYRSGGTLIYAMLEKLDRYEPRPQPRPGDEAEDGEYWALTFEDGHAGLFKRNNGEWCHEGKRRRVLDERWRTIIAAERIWPKEEA